MRYVFVRDSHKNSQRNTKKLATCGDACMDSAERSVDSQLCMAELTRVARGFVYKWTFVSETLRNTGAQNPLFFVSFRGFSWP